MSIRSVVSRITAVTLIVASLGCETSPTGPSDPATESFAAALGVNLATMTRFSQDLYYQDLVVGTGTATATNGRKLFVTYSGYFTDGTQFDSNVGKAPHGFTLGAHEVITGWELGVAGMKVGGKRKLVIGSSYAYGAAGQGSIGRHKTLVFDVELVSMQ